MSMNVVCVGIDVDDVQYHGSALDRQTGEVLSFQCRPMLKGLVGQLENVRKHFGGAGRVYAHGLLTVVAPPDAEVEQDRDLLRSRQRLIQHLFRQKGEICGVTFSHCCGVTGCTMLHYKAECVSKTHWRWRRDMRNRSRR